MTEPIILIVGGLIFLLFLLLVFFISRYKRCPSDKILVIYGRTSGGGSAKCLAGGAAFVWPVIQAYEYLDLTPISIDVDLRGALSKQNIRVNVPSRFTVGISNQDGIMLNAAERLLGKSREEIRDIAKDIIFGQLRLVVATMDIEEINSDRDKFLSNVATNVGAELRKIGLVLINVNVTDIQDESGYIEALGKEAAAKAINDAKQSVAEKNRDGSIGEANAKKDQRIQVSSADADAKIGEIDANAKAVEGENEAKVKIAQSEAERSVGEANAKKDQRIKISSAEADAKIGEADANAKAIEGENESKVKIAQSDAERRKKEAEYLRMATAAEKIQAAKALEEAYLAEQEAEQARSKRDLATKEADIIVQAEIDKRKLEIEAEAEAEQKRRIAKGEADAIYMKQEAEARGLYEVMTKQAEGFEKLVEAAGGNARDAILMLIADKLENLVKTQVEAIKNIKIDKVTVWDGSNGKNEGNSTANFLSNMYKAVPPMKDLFDMAGMDLPGYLGQAQAPQTEEKHSENGHEAEANTENKS